MDYGVLRHFADSWGLLLMVAAFAAVLVWVFRPGGRKAQNDAARQIFRNEDAPMQDAPNKDDEHGH